MRQECIKQKTTKNIYTNAQYMKWLMKERELERISLGNHPLLCFTAGYAGAPYYENKLNIKGTIIKPTIENVAKMNEIFVYLKEHHAETYTKTKSGGISTYSRRQAFHYPAYGIVKSNRGFEITILLGMHGWHYRLMFRAEELMESTGKIMYGREALGKFEKLCLAENINLQDYAINNGEELNKTIEKPYICPGVDGRADEVYENCHHIDFHSSYPAGLVNKHPEFYNVINKLYENRKTNKDCKAILNYTIGMFHSKIIDYELAELAKDAIEDNNDRIRDLTKKLKDSDRRVILYNTDGIWYVGDIYHDENEGTKLGQYSNDHINCTLRFKSAGAYEYIEDNKYHPVVRGNTTLDRIKARADWEWGDIYNGTTIRFELDEENLTLKTIDIYGGEYKWEEED